MLLFSKENEIVLLQSSRLHTIWDSCTLLLTSGKCSLETQCCIPEGMGCLKCCDICVSKKPFLRGVLSGPVEIDGFQIHPRHSSLSPQTFDVWKEEYASMTNIHPWLQKSSSHRAFVNSVPMQCLDSILQ